MSSAILIEPADLPGAAGAVIFDCRFSLANPAQGREEYLAGHIPGAHYIHLEDDLSGPLGRHGGRHPLPDPRTFAATLARFGVGMDTEVIAYDDSRLAFGARLWWLMRNLGYRPPRLLDGGYQGYLRAGGRPEIDLPGPRNCPAPPVSAFTGHCDREGLRALQDQGVLLVDSREERRYLGLEEPIDPLAGHIPGAINRPWYGVTSDAGRVLDAAGQRAHWGDVLEARELVVYCGSGVTACVNLFSLSLLGRDDPVLYAGSWSDWCSYLV